jgi:hypothetical protein
MLKNNILLSIFAAFAIITLFIVRWVNNTQRELDLCEIFHKNVESGILSAMNLSSSLNGKVFEVGNAAFYNAEFSEIKGPASFENAIILYINSEMCNPCVQYALNTFSEIQINSEKINFFIYGKSPDITMCQGFMCLFLLTRQGSNLNSSEPKSDVLPITPRVTIFR